MLSRVTANTTTCYRSKIQNHLVCRPFTSQIYGPYLSLDLESSFDGPMASETFLFVIGEEEEEFHVRKDVVSRQSPVLNVLVNGPMREAGEGCVRWPDVDPDTFERFAAYAYTGSYDDAPPGRLCLSEDTGLADSAAELPWLRLRGALGGTKRKREPTDQAGCDLAGGETSDSEDALEMSGSSCATSESESGSEPESEAEIYFGDQGNIDLSDDDHPEELSSDDGYYAEEPRRREFPEQSEDGDSQDPEAIFNDQADVVAPYATLPFDLASYLADEDSRSEMLRYTDLDDRSSSTKEHHLRPGSPCSLGRFARRLRSRHQDLVLSSPPIVHRDQALWNPRRNIHPAEVFEPVLLSHAWLYVLADRYRVDHLRRLCLSRLHRTLMPLLVFPERVPDLVALTHVLYANTAQGDPSRALVLDFWLCFLDHVAAMGDFKNLVCRQADFAADLAAATASQPACETKGHA